MGKKRFIDGELTQDKKKIVLSEESRTGGGSSLFEATRLAKIKIQVVLEKIAGRWFRRKEVDFGEKKELTESKQVRLERKVGKMKAGKLKTKDIEDIEEDTE